MQRAAPMKLVLLDENCAETAARVGPGDDSESTENASVSVMRIQGCTHLTRLAPRCSSQTRQGRGHRGCDYGRASFDKIIDVIRDYELHGIFILWSRTLVSVRPSSSASRSRWSRVLWAAWQNSAGLQSGMRRSEAGCSSIVRASALPLACCSLPYEWRPCGRALGGSPPSRVHACE